MNQQYVVHTAVNFMQTVKMYVVKMYTLQFYSAPGRGEEYCGEHVCLCVCVCVCVCLSVFGTACPIFTKIFVHFSSVLFLQRSDPLCTSDFMNDVTFADKPRLLDVATQLKRSAHAALGLAIDCEQ